MGSISTPISTCPWDGRLRALSPHCRAFYQRQLHEAWPRVDSSARLSPHPYASGPGTGPRSWLGGIALVAAALARARASGSFAGAVLGAELCACARTRGGLR